MVYGQGRAEGGTPPTTVGGPGPWGGPGLGLTKGEKKKRRKKKRKKRKKKKRSKKKGEKKKKRKK